MVNRKLNAVIGLAGSGKTEAVKMYNQENTDCILITATENITHKAFMLQMVEDLGITTKEETAVALTRVVIRHLKKQEIMLIVDEAENLPLVSLKVLRNIWEISHTPMVIVGTKELQKKINGEGGQLEYLRSRIADTHMMQPLDDKELEEIFGEFGHKIYKLAGGSFRKAANMWENANSHAKATNRELQVAHIQEAYKSMSAFI